jgi:hypothetical protein
MCDGWNGARTASRPSRISNRHLAVEPRSAVLERAPAVSSLTPPPPTAVTALEGHSPATISNPRQGSPREPFASALELLDRSSTPPNDRVLGRVALLLWRERRCAGGMPGRCA